jgi:5-deoxy-glucuronate isomerase
MEHLIRPNHKTQILIDITPESAGWDYLSFKVISLKAGEEYKQETGGNEVALVPLQGQAALTADEETFEVSRQGYFKELPHILYAPPGTAITARAVSDFEFAAGGAPAEGRSPRRWCRHTPGQSCPGPPIARRAADFV